MRRFGRFIILTVLLGALFAGCVRRPGDDGDSPAPAPNACTPYAKPEPDWESANIRGQNAFDFVVGLLCDHGSGHGVERARVPGTDNHTGGAAFLADTLKKAGWNVKFQNFTGNDYFAIMQNRQGSSYAQYLSPPYCSPADENRARGLRFANIEGQFGSSTGGIVVFMAHWDSKRFADGDPDPQRHDEPVLGANDGASGVGVLLELARVLAKESQTWDLRFFLTDGEDGFEDCHPLAGSTYYADKLSMSTAERARVRAIALLDMVGDPNAGFYKGCGTDSALADRIWAVAGRLDVRQFKSGGGCAILDDHTPFEERNMRTVDVIDLDGGFPPYWHTTGDTPDKLTPEMLGAVARVFQQLVKELPIAG